MQALLASTASARTIMAALAVVLPLLLGGLFHRQTLRLRALADHGRRAEATLVDRRSGGAFYRYEWCTALSGATRWRRCSPWWS